MSKIIRLFEKNGELIGRFAPITEEDNVKSEDTLYYFDNVFNRMEPLKILRVTKTMIVTQHLRFRFNGSVVGDEFPRQNLYRRIS